MALSRSLEAVVYAFEYEYLIENMDAIPATVNDLFAF